jgi:chromosome segregation ATPase
MLNLYHEVNLVLKLEIEKMIEDRTHALKSIEELRNDKTLALKLNEELRNDKANALKSIEELRNDKTHLKDINKDLRDILIDLRNDKTKMSKTVDDLQISSPESSCSKTEISILIEEFGLKITDITSQIITANNNLDKCNANLTSEKSVNIELKENLSQKTSEAANCRIEITAADVNLSKCNSDLTSETAKLMLTINDLTSQIKEKDTDAEVCASKLQIIEEKVKDLEKQINTTVSCYIMSST